MKTKILSKAVLITLTLHNVLAITKVSLVDHNDPDYTDKCLEITGELCDYCCMVDFEWCSRDIYNCQPTFERDLMKMYQAGAILGLIVVGFPMSVCILRNCMINRCMARFFPNTNGISLFECGARVFMFTCCCGRRFSTPYEIAQSGEEDEGKAEVKKGCC